MGSTITPFRSRFNDYKSGTKKVSKTATTDRAENILELKRKESYWQHMFSTFIPNGLNERFVGIPTL